FYLLSCAAHASGLFLWQIRRSMSAPADSRAGRIAFTHPDFVLFQIARFLIVAAVEMQAVAVGWQVYDITKRALDLGLVGLAQFLPGILLFLVSGLRRIDSIGEKCWVPAMRDSRCA